VPSPRTIYSVGHSTLSYESFLELLRFAKITAVADVRTSPYSRHHPHFNRESLKEGLRLDGISYVFLGRELGGRPEEKGLFSDGVADYERMALLPSFEKGIERVIEGAQKYRVALMCSEHDPLTCHRCLLVGRALFNRGQMVQHLLMNKSLLDQAEIEKQLLNLSGRQTKDMFATREEEISAAYRKQAQKMAFGEPIAESKISIADSASNRSSTPESRS
jgi:uncharacterized protein (DUF488 family)